MKWSKKLINKEVAEMNNSQLLEETIDLAGGDDYDGFFTPKGTYTFRALSDELEKRLKLIGFLPNKKSK